MPPARSSYADIIIDAEKLLSACTVNASLLPDLTELRRPLEEVLAQIKALTTQKETFKADKQKTTQDLRALLKEARDLVLQLRATVKGRLGARTEKLTEFGVQPIRSRPRKANSGGTFPVDPITPGAAPPKPAT